MTQAALQQQQVETQPQALAIEPHNTELNLEDYRGRLLSQQQQDIITRLLGRSAEAYSQSALAGISQAQVELFRERCLHFCRRVLHIAPRHSEALALLSRMALDVNDLDTAKRHIKAALASAPNSALCWYSYGHIFLADQSLEMAKHSFSKAAKLEPTHFRAKASYAHVLLRQGNIAGAYSIYKKLIQISPKDPHVKANLFDCLKQLEADKDSHLLDQELRSYLQLEDINPADLNRLISSLLIHRYNLNNENSEVDIAALACDGLYTDALEKLIFCNLDVEKLNLVVREFLLNTPNTHTQELRLRASLACQAFNNEYVWSITAQEAAQLDLHCRSLQQLLALDELDQEQHLQVLSLWLNIIMYEANDQYTLPQTKLVNVLVEATGILVNSHNAAFGTISHLIKLHIVKPKPETMPSIGQISDRVSKKVKQQYELNPYPRWLNLPYQTPTSYRQAINLALPNNRFNADGEVLQVLVAGCGTGQHALQTAKYFRDCFVTAIDLSDASLSYAKRMAEKSNISNIRFIKMDLLELSDLDQKFDLIECSGVLHHMREPIEGAKALKAALKDNGIIKLGLYSERAREQVVQCRQLIAAENIDHGLVGMRKLRKRLMQQHKSWSEIISSPDFFSMSGVRDLLFHEQEHRFTPIQLEQLSKAIGTEFLGFIRLDPQARQRYTEQFPADSNLNDLGNWDIFEKQNRNCFASMYQFYLQG